MSAPNHQPVTEETDAGSQTILRGVAPIMQRDQLAVLAEAPMTPPSAQKKCDHGLFDLNSRRQSDLVDELRRLDHAKHSKSNSKGE